MSVDSSERFEELGKYFTSVPPPRCPFDSVYSASPPDVGKWGHSRGKTEPSVISGCRCSLYQRQLVLAFYELLGGHASEMVSLSPGCEQSCLTGRAVGEAAAGRQAAITQAFRRELES